MRDGDLRIAQPSMSPHGARILLLLAALAASLLMLVPAGTASAAYVHPEASYEFGPTGTSASSFAGATLDELTYNQATKKLYLIKKDPPRKLYGFTFLAPGSFAALEGNFPVSLTDRSGDPQIDTDNTALSTAGNIYHAPDNADVQGFDSAGESILGFDLTETAGENCGLAVDNQGYLWLGNYSTHRIEKYSPSGGAAIGSVDVSAQGSPCSVTFDRGTGDLYVSIYGTPKVVRYTASSGYSEATAKVYETGFSGADAVNAVAVNATSHVLYAARGNAIEVYDTVTGLNKEEFGVGGCYRGIAVDDATDTVFTSNNCTNKVQEWKGVVVPDVTTGEPTGNSTVSGSVALSGAGPVLECKFEYTKTSEYTGASQPCAPATPYNADQAQVTASLPLEGEVEYKYRIVARNANGTARGGNKTITAHNVKFLTTEPASDVTTDSAVLHASFEGTNEDTHYYFEWGRTKTYGHATASPPGLDAGVTVGPTHLESELTDLLQGATYHFRVVAENSLGVSRGLDQSFKTEEPPAIESFTSSGVTATSAEIGAAINPRGFETTYHVEYGVTPAYGAVAPVPDGVLPSDSASHSVIVPLTGLESRVYHFRIVAENKWGVSRSGDQTFNFFPPDCPNAQFRQETGSAYLPDCRAYELVSPGDTGNVNLQPNAIGALPYASNPPRLSFYGKWGAVPGFDSPNNSIDPYVSTRTQSGWVTKYVGVLGSEHSGACVPEIASEDLSKFLELDNQSCLGIPTVWDYNGKSLGRWPTTPTPIPNVGQSIGYYRASADFSHLAISSNNVNFDPEGHGLTKAPGSAYDYNSETGTITLISLDAENHPIAQEPGITDKNEVIRFPGGEQFEPAISKDGSHILMQTFGIGGVRLYMRVDASVTYEVSLKKYVQFIGMSSDGTRVYYSSKEQLIPGEDHDSSADIYMWSEEGELANEPLTLISKGDNPGAAGEPGNSDSCTASWTNGCNAEAVEGIATEVDNAIADESGDIYFYSPEQLDGPDNGLEGARNLFVFRNGRARFVAQLNTDNPGRVTRIQVSPDGEHAAFITASQLTNYDNTAPDEVCSRERGTGEPLTGPDCTEMYTYEPSRGEVHCVSCMPNGKPPVSDTEGSRGGIFMTNDGRAFFSTLNPLVVQDTDNRVDIYEFVEGRPQLISSGTSEQDGRGPVRIFIAGLVGVSADGLDVYFSTYDSLVREDHNGPYLKFYDARTGGGFVAEAPRQPCEAADECHGPGSVRATKPAMVSAGDLGMGGNTASKPKRRRHGRKHRHGHHRKTKTKVVTHSPKRGARR